MKYMKSLCMAFALILPSLFFAQTVDKEIDNALKEAFKEYKSIVSPYIEVSKENEEGYWNIVKEYRTEYNEIFKNQVLLLSKDVALMSPKEITDFTKEIKGSQKSLEKVRQKYYGRLKKVLAPKEVLKFMQVDHFLNIYREYKLASYTPWVQ